MSSEHWAVLSQWHNQWLAAAGAERDHLRAQFAAQHPELLAEADGLARASAGLHGFLETPAFLLAARDIAGDVPALAPDRLVGPYRIVSLLARGGMGDVYRATDVRLQRDVALKFLAYSQAADPYRVERFLQEARITASLDHPNVVRVYDVGLLDDRPYLVAELLNGETLRTRIARGPLPPLDAGRITAEVASGLVAAHAAGLVHRDLKPENLFVTRSGTTKILDFGIAKLLARPAAPGSASTSTGVLLGTAGYLSPEQVNGDAVDARADLFALGSILFEMLTGRRAFAREHTVDTLHAIVHDPPPDLIGARPEVSPHLAAIVTRLLAKSPGDRFQTAADLAWAVGQIGGVPGPASSASPSAVRVRPWRSRSMAWSAAAALGLVIAYAGWAGRPAAPAAGQTPLTRFTWPLAAGLALDSRPEISPDGRRVVFAALEGAESRLFVWSLDATEATAITGTEGAKQPFWSPDGLSVGFFRRGKLMKIALAGGAPVELCDAPDGRGGAWSAAGVIVFGPDVTEAPLFRVSANGGPAEPATRLDLSHGDNSHRWPVFLPDGVHFLYFVRAFDDDRRGVYVGRIDGPPTLPGAPLFRAEAEAVFAPATSAEDPAVLLNVASGRVEARRFDLARLQVIGDAQVLGVAAGGNTPYQPAMLSASANALSVATSPVQFGYRLVSVLRDGRELQIAQNRESQNWPRLSPDGLRLALSRVDPLKGASDIWVDDLGGRTRVRVTTAADRDIFPVWSPDGRQIVYLSGRFGAHHLSIAAADGTGVARELPCPGAYCEPTDWAPDGERLLVNVRGAHDGDVWVVPLDPHAAPYPLLDDGFTERDARLSPDGRWVSYVSDESGRAEVSIRAVSGPPRRVVISGGGGDQPVWGRHRSELFFVDPAGRLRSVSIRLAPGGQPAFGAPTELNIPAIGKGHWGTQYDVSPDGARVYLLQAAPEPRHDEIGLILGWRALLAPERRSR